MKHITPSPTLPWLKSSHREPESTTQTSRSLTKVPRGRARIPQRETFEDVSRSWPAGWTRLKAKKLSCWMSHWKVWIPTCGNLQFSPCETEEWNNRASTFHEKYTTVIASFEHAFVSKVFCRVDSCVFPSANIPKVFFFFLWSSESVA